jgi:hypothetical protein
MKSTSPLLILAVACLSACASHPKITEVPSAAPVVPDTVLDPANQQNVRNSSVVQTLSVGPSQDPTNPNIREDAHNIERVVEPESWNLHPNVPTAINMGPIVAINDPNRQTEPMTPELIQKIQEENQLLKVTTEQNDAMAAKIAELQAILKTKQMTEQENADLTARVLQLEKAQKELEDKLEQTKPVSNGTPASKS